MDPASNPFVQAVDDGELRVRRTSVISVARDTKEIELRHYSIKEEPERLTAGVSTNVIEIEESVIDYENTFPEGGRQAWLVVLGAWLMLFPTFGLQVSIGTVQDYWAQNQLSEYSAQVIGWIPSIFVYLGLSMGLIVGPLFDRYGPKYIVPIATTSYLVMIFLLAECSKYWQFMLCTGIFGGICAGFIITTGLATVSHWFKAKRGLAHGVSMIGSSFGGLTIPLILRATLPKYGYKWSIRILGFIFLVCFLLSNLLVKARIPPGLGKKKSIVSISIFKDARLSFFTVSVFGIEVVLFGALGILPTYATVSTTFSADTGFYLISTLNGVSSLGRILTGYLSDRYGRFNVFSVAMVFTLLIMLVVWLPFGANNLAALYTFTALFGFATGSWMALVPACVGQLCRADEFGTYYGSMYFAAGSSLLIAIPICGALVEGPGAQPLVGFLCAVLGLSTLTFFTSRWACLGWRWSWRAKV